MHWAAAKGNVGIVEELLFIGAPPDAEDNWGVAPIFVPVVREASLSRDMDAASANAPHPCFHDKITTAQLHGMLEAFLQATDVNKVDSYGGHTLLYYAIVSDPDDEGPCTIETVEGLLRNGAALTEAESLTISTLCEEAAESGNARLTARM